MLRSCFMLTRRGRQAGWNMLQLAIDALYPGGFVLTLKPVKPIEEIREAIDRKLAMQGDKLGGGAASNPFAARQERSLFAAIRPATRDCHLRSGKRLRARPQECGGVNQLEITG